MYNEEQRWTEVDGFPKYQLSDDGVVKNIKTGHILKQSDNNGGYPTLNLYNNGSRRTVSIHRLVAEHFIACGDPDLEVNHLDGNKHNNYYSI